MYRKCRHKILLFTFFVLLFISSFSQTKSDSGIIGTWKGESICQIKNSPCHDEIAAYHVSKAKEPNVFHFEMNKIVNRKEEEMGPLEFIYNAATQTLTSIDEKRNTIWKFQIKDTAMEGALMYNGELYRIIHLKKQ